MEYFTKFVSTLTGSIAIQLTLEILQKWMEMALLSRFSVMTTFPKHFAWLYLELRVLPSFSVSVLVAQSERGWVCQTQTLMTGLSLHVHICRGVTWLASAHTLHALRYRWRDVSEPRWWRKELSRKKLEICRVKMITHDRGNHCQCGHVE